MRQRSFPQMIQNHVVAACAGLFFTRSKAPMIIKNISNILALGMFTLGCLLTWENLFESMSSSFMFHRVSFAYFPRFS